MLILSPEEENFSQNPKSIVGFFAIPYTGVRDLRERPKQQHKGWLVAAGPSSGSTAALRLCCRERFFFDLECAKKNKVQKRRQVRGELSERS
jgi:hypothetical protein